MVRSWCNSASFGSEVAQAETKRPEFELHCDVHAESWCHLCLVFCPTLRAREKIVRSMGVGGCGFGQACPPKTLHVVKHLSQTLHVRTPSTCIVECWRSPRSHPPPPRGRIFLFWEHVHRAEGMDSMEGMEVYKNVCYCLV